MCCSALESGLESIQRKDAKRVRNTGHGIFAEQSGKDEHLFSVLVFCDSVEAMGHPVSDCNLFRLFKNARSIYRHGQNSKCAILKHVS